MKDSEPVMILGLVSAALTAWQTFGHKVTEAQTHAILGLVGAALTVAAAFWARSKVTPTSKLPPKVDS